MRDQTLTEAFALELMREGRPLMKMRICRISNLRP
jgi:hypothetical protein